MHETFSLILGLAGLLTIASFLLPIARRLNFPYTVLLAVAGSVLGGIVLLVKDVQGLWLLGDFLEALDRFDITSELVFFVFLPTLIFESTLNISVRHLLEDIGTILILAVVGLLISTFVVGLAVREVSSVGLVACLLLGAIVSATDPVAVVAIFKDLGAPKRLTILVEGESLFNDATAIVLFTILAGTLMGESETGVLAGAVDFLRVFCGGILVGMANAWIVIAIIGRLHKMPLIEITLTVCLAYFAFLLAEHYLHVSGVMAVVSAGLMVRSQGRTKVSPATWHTLTETWEQLGFWANSLIFFLVGLLVPEVLLDFVGVEFTTLLVLVVAAFGARAVVLYGLLPGLARLGIGQRISLKFRTVMFWGGLRGAVSLALALVILESPRVDPALKEFIAVLVTGFVLFTLFVNATTMPLLMKLLGLDKPPSREQAMRNRIMALSLSHIRDDLNRAAEAYRIDE
ncbi:MAG: cation:proton antiporter, partial [Candidatus Competibacteraceae bacterium]|nr:cation:proton antiporter [Candidatus Competibacteraceae bacterium]